MVEVGAPGEIISCFPALNPMGRAKARSNRLSCRLIIKSHPCDFPLRAALKCVQIGYPADLVKLMWEYSFSELVHKKTTASGGFLYGAPGEIRTPDQPVRSRLLYPAELRAHCSFAYYILFFKVKLTLLSLIFKQVVVPTSPERLLSASMHFALRAALKCVQIGSPADLVELPTNRF